MGLAAAAAAASAKRNARDVPTNPSSGDWRSILSLDFNHLKALEGLLPFGIAGLRAKDGVEEYEAKITALRGTF